MKRMNLSQKGLLIVSVPLIFESVFILLLLFMLNQVNDALEREETARSVMSTAHHLGRCLINVSSAAASISFSISLQRSNEKLIENMDKSEQDLARMTQLLQHHPRELKIVKEIETSFYKTARLVEQRSEGVRTGTTPILEDPRMGELASGIAGLNNGLHRLVQVEREATAESLERLATMKKAIEIVLIGGLCASVVITVILMIFFARDIVQRLSALSTNAALMGKRQPLGMTVFGDDEISELDAALRRTDDELSQLAQARQNLIAFVSHELKTPLTSLSAFFSMLSTGALAPLSENAIRTANYATLRLNDINTMINDLIDIEKLQGGMFRLLLSDVDLESLIETGIRKFSEKYETSMTIEITEVDDAVFTGDRDRLNRVLVSLFRNGLSRAGSNDSPVLYVKAKEVGGFIEIEVSDNGAPIGNLLKECVFERDQLSGDKASLDVFLNDGLPLVVGRLILEQHGGSFGLSTDATGTTRFLCRIPTSLVNDEDSVG